MPITGREPANARTSDAQRVHVAVGVISDDRGQFLICRRPAHLHQGGLWEFPGGKVERDETVEQALARELREELDVEVQEAQPLVKISHAYPDKRVLLDVWRILRWRGPARPREEQCLRWVPRTALRDYNFPAANYEILQAIGGD